MDEIQYEEILEDTSQTLNHRVGMETKLPFSQIKNWLAVPALQ